MFKKSNSVKQIAKEISSSPRLENLMRATSQNPRLLVALDELCKLDLDEVAITRTIKTARSGEFADLVTSPTCQRVLDISRNTSGEPKIQSAVGRLMSHLSSGEVDIETINLCNNIASSDSGDWRAINKALLRVSSMPEEVRMILREISVDAPEVLKKIGFFAHLFRRTTYWEDLFASRATAAWLEDEKFKRSYNAGAKISVWGNDIRWRVYTLLQAAVLANRVEGDFVECGTDRGGTAMCVIDYVGIDAFHDRDFFLFDTFAGLDHELMTTKEKELSRLTEDRYPDVFELVSKTFSENSFVKIVRGPIPKTLPEFKGNKVAYLHIDMNVALPERAAFEYFWPMLSPGAPVIFDDYAFPFHVEQKKSLDEAAAALGTTIMMLPTGQGICWK